jgi:uncharacterized membrane protein HdeD (DUF308 family)
MAAHVGEKPRLLLKKLGGLLLVIFGCLLMAVGLNTGAIALTAIGSLLLSAGLGLMVHKIVQRNQDMHH